MSRELCIIKAYSIFLRSSKLSWLATLALRKFKDLLPENTIETCSCSQYLPVVGRTPVTIRFSSLFVGLQRWYILRQRRLLIHLNWRRQFQTFLAFLMLLPSRQVDYKLIFVVINYKKMLRNEPRQIPIQVVADGNRCTLAPRLDCPQLRVLAPPVSLLSSTTISTYTFSTKTSNKNLMTTCLA